MDMRIKGLCWLLWALPLGGYAQETGPTAERASEIDAIEPGMSSEDLETLDEAPKGAGETAPAAVLAADVRRRSADGGVMDELDLGRSEVTGNQELPKVLYIVPWKKSDPGSLLGKPVNTLLDEVLAPVDRSEFLRQVDYYGDLHGKDKEQ